MTMLTDTSISIWLYTAFFMGFAYLLGSLPFAIISSKIFSLPDPRQFGSGNPGATNVLRSGHKIAALFTLLGDALKGYVAVFFASFFLVDFPIGLALVALSAFLGHLYSIFLGFKGGKGVATAIGVLFALTPLLALGLIVVWLLVAFFFRYSSLAALLASAIAPLLYLLIYQAQAHMAFFLLIVLISTLLIYKHKSNIQKLLAGTESKIGKKR